MEVYIILQYFMYKIHNTKATCGQLLQHTIAGDPLQQHGLLHLHQHVAGIIASCAINTNAHLHTVVQ
jgi:hypothetical protein